MRVRVKNTTKKEGWFSSTILYGVTVEIVFGEYDKAVIKLRNLGSTVLLQRGHPAGVYPDEYDNKLENYYYLTVDKLLQGPDTYYFFKLHEAKNYIELFQQTCEGLRNLIDQNGDEPGDINYDT